jgi:ribosomal-protein-alanine N-acetyltransferase
MPWSRELLREEIFFPLSLNLALFVEDILRGYLFTWLIPPEVHILNLAIDPAFRKKGFGTRLMKELIDEAKLAGGTKFTLEVRAGNHDSVAFYQKLQFVTKGVRKGYYQDTGEDALIMWKEL